MIILELLIKVKCLIKRLILIKDYSSKNIFCMRLLVEYEMKTDCFHLCFHTVLGDISWSRDLPFGFNGSAILSVVHNLGRVSVGVSTHVSVL